MPVIVLDERRDGDQYPLGCCPNWRRSMSAPPRAVGAQPTASLAAGRLGVPAVLFFVMSAATPLTVVAGVVTTGFATTGLIGIPVAFVVVGLLLAVFSV